MRTIKFRAWYNGDEFDEEFYHSRMIYNIQKCYDGGIEFRGRGSFGSFLNDEDFIVEEFTGCLDAKNNEIYEGDIVRIMYENSSNIGFVIFDEGSFLIKVSNSDIRGIWSGEDIEVIGNIHENLGLLNK
jgi:uncharacterized phage protein (TIGR01671 family)